MVRERRPGISAARNAGVAAATGEIIAFTDDDVRVDPLWLRAIGERFASDSAIEAVTGLILPAELETPAQVWFERYYGGFSGERTFAPLTLKAADSGPTVAARLQGRCHATPKDAWCAVRRLRRGGVRCRREHGLPAQRTAAPGRIRPGTGHRNTRPRR